MFKLHCVNDQIWNMIQLIDYLVKNQQKDILIDIVPEAICLDNLGFYKILDCFEFERVSIHTENPFETHDRYQIVLKTRNEFIKESVSVDPTFHQWSKKYKFITVYGRPTASRLGLASYLFTTYYDSSKLHFRAGNSTDDYVLYEMNKLLGFDPRSVSRAISMSQHMPLLLESRDNYDPKHYNFSDPITLHYQDCLVDIVSETHVAGNTYFITEKSTRPIWLKKPFVIFSAKNHLAYMRQQGFRTFGDFWDETYDGYEGRERYLRILDLIDWIAGHSYNQLETMYWDMQYTLDHNYNLLLKQNYNNQLTKLS